MLALGARRRVVYEENVEVGSVPDISAAELAHCDDRQALRLSAHLVADRAVEDGVGQGRDPPGRLAGVELAREIGHRHGHRHAPLSAPLRPDERLAPLVRISLHRHLALERVDLLLHEPACLGDRDGSFGEQHHIRQVRSGRDGFSDEGARAEHRDQAPHGARLAGDRRQICSGRRESSEEGPQVPRRLLGIRRASESVEHAVGEVWVALQGEIA